MKALWVDVRPWNKDLATTAIESGADALVVDEAAAVRELGRITAVAPDGDLVPGQDVFWVEISTKESEEKAAQLAAGGLVVVTTTDWTVIPLENLVAASDRIIARVGSAAEAELALNVLEIGVHGILVDTPDPAEVRAIAALLQRGEESLPLVSFTVSGIRSVGMGDRVCVDTCSLLADGEGLLVGNTSEAFLLVHAETLENPYVAPRPFRVNAGTVHAYALMPGKKTSYLSELGVGDGVLVVDANGETHDAVVGRVKIERRPLVVVEAERDGTKVSLVLQNAETIRLVGEDGAAISVVDLAPGTRVLGYTTTGGRHFGMAVDETIIEK
jgi:3-dehydroquinate synthase II